MNQSNIMSIINVIRNIIPFLYSQNSKKYFLEIKFVKNNINLLIKEQFEANSIININVPGKIDIFNLISRCIVNMVINNSDAFGCLSTSYINGERKVKGQIIKSQNLEINLPIYNRAELAYAEKTNDIMINKLNDCNVNAKQKILTK